jgi:hypothetical protein
MPDETVHLLYIKLSVMKRLTILFLILTGSVTLATAQPPIEPTRRYEGTVEYQKTKQPATILEFKYPEKDLEKAMEAYMEKQGGKVKFQKGFNYVKNVRVHERENRYYDLYYKVEGSGKGDNANSTMYIILAEPGENILLRGGNSSNNGTAAASVGAVAFVGALGSEVGSYDYEKKIKDQQAEVERAEKRKAELEKKRDKLIKDLDVATQDLQRQASDVDKAKAILEQLKSGKKN